MVGFGQPWPSSSARRTRSLTLETKRCDDELHRMSGDIDRRVRQCDPDNGSWNISGSEATVWVDASSLATGVVVAVDGRTVEDACWLRGEDGGHINMAELDALIKGVNVALT